VRWVFLKDLFNSIADVVGSVANYLAKHGWVRDGAIADTWNASQESQAAARQLVTKSLKPSHGAATVSALGFSSGNLSPATRNGQKLSVMTMNGQQGEEFWIAYKNFYAITRYNHSRLYALAVFQLAEAIKQTAQ